MSFLKSEFVRSELVQITELQEKVYDNILKYPTMTNTEKLSHIEILEKLLTKQQVLYTRLSLSDDPEAKEIKYRIIESIKLMGASESMNINIIFNNMKQVLQTIKKTLDKTEDPDL